MGVLLIGFFVLVAYYVLRPSDPTSANGISLPPGPKALPVIGNILDLTTHELWLRLTKWAKQYGDTVYVHVFGQGFVFLNSYEAAADLLDKKGVIYSDKPASVMIGELCGCENMVAFTRYGDMSRRQRKLMNFALGPNAVCNYRPLLEMEGLALVERILQDPKDYLKDIRRFAGGLTLQSIYGYRVASKDDPLINLAEECVNILANEIASTGGIWLVDIFPVLKHLPLWFPGAGFKRKAIKWKAKMEEFTDRPYEWVKERMRNGTAAPCFVTTLLDEASGKEGLEEGIDAQRDFDIRWTANSMYSASIDTTLTVLQHFLLAMIKYPHVLKQAQAEMDNIVGTTRLPTFDDRASLTYLGCVMNEVLRWGVPVPMGLPHRLMEDDVYKGFFIPKGSFVLANIWNMLRDADLYPDPDAFIPERFLAEAEPTTPAWPEVSSTDKSAQDGNTNKNKLRDPRHYVFGFGRRRCPGAYLIEESLWIVMATMVATLDVSAPWSQPADGKVKTAGDGGAVVPGNRAGGSECSAAVELGVTFDNPVFRTPSPFECDIRPRSPHVLKVLRQATEALGIQQPGVF